MENCPLVSFSDFTKKSSNASTMSSFLKFLITQNLKLKYQNKTLIELIYYYSFFLYIKKYLFSLLFYVNQQVIK
jgi:hypothetical protein